MFTIVQDYDRVVWLLFGLYLVSGAVMDLRSKSVPRWWLAAGAALALVLIAYPAICSSVSPDLAEGESAYLLRVAGVMVGGIFMLVSWARPESFGRADSLLIVMIGALIGLLRVIDVLVIAFLLTVMYGMICCGRGRFRAETIAFIPFLAIGFFVQGAVSLWHA